MKRLQVFTGPGSVIRFGDICIWTGPEASASLLEFLELSARNLAESARGGRLLADHVGRVLHQHDPEPSASFATLGPDGASHNAVLLHGSACLFDGTGWLRPDPAAGWSTATIDATANLAVATSGATTEVADRDPFLNLERGIVPGGGFLLVDGESVSPAPARNAAGRGAPNAEIVDSDQTTVLAAVHGGPGVHPAPDPTVVLPITSLSAPATALSVPQVTSGDDSADSGSDPTIAGFIATASPTELTPRLASPDPSPSLRPAGVLGIDLRDPEPGSPGAGSVIGAPVVVGRRCPRGHFNHPSAVRCVICDQPIAELGSVSGPRPALGVLVVDDGSVFSLRRPYLIGSRARMDPTVSGGASWALELAGSGVAPAHAELRLDGWDLHLVDRASSSGTHVLDKDEGTWRKVAPYRPEKIRPGTHIAVGSRVLTFISPWPEG